MEFGLCVFILLAIIYFYLGYYKNLKQEREINIKLNGIEARATVLYIECNENWKEAKLPNIQVQVEPVHGRNFVSELIDIPEQVISSLKIGDKILVKYLAKNLREPVFVKLSSQK